MTGVFIRDIWAHGRGRYAAWGHQRQEAAGREPVGPGEGAWLCPHLDFRLPETTREQVPVGLSPQLGAICCSRPGTWTYGPDLQPHLSGCWSLNSCSRPGHRCTSLRPTPAASRSSLLRLQSTPSELRPPTAAACPGPQHPGTAPLAPAHPSPLGRRVFTASFCSRSPFVCSALGCWADAQ